MLFPTWIFASFETPAYAAYVPCCSNDTVQNHDSTLFQISHEMTPEDAALHEMLSMENGSGPYFFSFISIRHWGTQRYSKMPRNGWRKVKIFSLHELSNTVRIWGDPTQLPWAMKRKKNTFALVQILTCRWSCQPFAPCCFHLGLQVRKKCPLLLQAGLAGMWLSTPWLVKILATDSSLLLQH